MIGSLRGTVIEVHPTHLLLEIAGIGYDVRASLTTLSRVTAGQQAFLYIHDHIREDAHDLYGFLSLDELGFFEQLISVSGVGPKLGLTILAGGPFDEVRRAVMSGDVTRLTSVPGIGKKTAQKIVLELKGQLVEAEATQPGDADVIQALVSLGYSAADARDAVKHVDEKVKDVSERVRESLKLLAT